MKKEVIRHSSGIIVDEYLYKQEFNFQRTLKHGIWFVTLQNCLITFGQYRHDLEEWIDKTYNIMNKKEQIEAYLAQPIKVGDEIIFTGEGNGSQNKASSAFANVSSVDGDIITFKASGSSKQTRNISEIKKSVRHIGQDPFQKPLRVSSYAFDINQLLYRLGLSKDLGNRMEEYFNVSIPSCVMSPIILDANGTQIDFQRGLVWTEKQKQLLIESIYNNVDIGKFVFRVRPFDWVKERIESGQLEGTGFSDLIDGKQRSNAIVGFVGNEFPDLAGNYYSELSKDAQNKFMGYMNLTYVEMPESTTDKEVIQQFLAINFSGVPMSQEHIDFVKSITL